MEAIKILVDIILYLAATGALTKEDILLICEVEPKIRIILEKWDILAKKYRPEILANYIWSLLSKYKRGDVLEQIKLVSLYIYRVPRTRLRLYLPFLSQVAAEIEKRLVEAGLMDHRLERMFDSLYETLSKEKTSHAEITAILNRILTFASKALSQKGAEVNTAVPSEIAKEAMRAIRPRRSSKITEEDIKKVVEIVYEYNEKGQKPYITKVLNDVIVRGITKDYRKAYDCIKKAVEEGYLEEENMKLSVTDKGKALINK